MVFHQRNSDRNGILAHRILEVKAGREDSVIVENKDSVLISLCLPINNDALANKGQRKGFLFVLK
jgi:hypothetical protein